MLVSVGQSEEAVYKAIVVSGSSRRSFEHAAQAAFRRAKAKFADLRLIRGARGQSVPEPSYSAEVVKFDVGIEAGEIARFRVRLRVTFSVGA